MQDNKINFLESALGDTQELIRFIETKTSVAVAIVGGYIALLYSWMDEIIKYANGYSWEFWVVFVIQIITILICLFMIHIAISPADNPANHITLGSASIPKPSFYITPNQYHNSFPSFCNSKKYKLKKRYDEYVNEIKSADEEAIINSLCFEVLKVNFIRNIKARRFSNLVIMISITTLWLVIATFFFKIETNNSKERVKSKSYTCVAEK